MVNLADLNAAERDEITYISGITEDGKIAKDSYWAFLYRDASDTDVWMNKWYNDSNGVPRAPTSHAGTPGGTVTYSYGAGLSSQAQAAYSLALSLWSDIADIQFKYTPDTDKANFLFVKQDGSSANFQNNGRQPMGGENISTQASPKNGGAGQATVGVPAPDDAYGKFGMDVAGLWGAIFHETGHLLGLGHAGNYNGGIFEGQRGPYDINIWTQMSYLAVGDATATFPATAVTDWQGGRPDTPMALDILAMQRFYGESKSSTFAGGQTYGFNTNITGGSRDLFDFTKNTIPFVSLYNRGVGNTLDVSGYSTNERINLNPGTFSTASPNSAIVNNINISFGTRIDKVVTGSGDDVIYGNGNSNVVDGGAGNNTFVITGSSTNFKIDRTSATNATVTDKTTGAVDTLTNIQRIRFDDPVCFTTGTRIAIVRDGVAREVPVEDLCPDDVAVTATGERRAIRWIGRRDVLPAAHPEPSKQWPVRILAGAFGTDARGRLVPARDLRLSPGHPVLIGADAENAGGVLTPVMNLIDGIAIRREPVDRVTYWHVELDRHDILLAEGLPAESYFECGARAWFGQDTAPGWWKDVDGAKSPLPGRCRPVAFDGPAIEAERSRIGGGLRLRLAAQAAWPTIETRIMEAA